MDLTEAAAVRPYDRPRRGRRKRDAAAVRFRDVPDDGEPETAAVARGWRRPGCRGRSARTHASLSSSRHAGPVVSHLCDREAAVALHARPNRLAGCRIVRGVLDEVLEDLATRCSSASMRIGVSGTATRFGARGNRCCSCSATPLTNARRGRSGCNCRMSRASTCESRSRSDEDAAHPPRLRLRLGDDLLALLGGKRAAA